MYRKIGRRWPNRVRRSRATLGSGAALLLSLASVASACGGSTAAKQHPGSPASSSASAGGVTDVTWWNMWSGSTVTALNKLVQKFNQTHPGIHVTQLNVPSADGDAKLLSAIAGGQPPDLFTEWNPVIGAYAQSGAIQPLDRFMTGKYAHLRSWYYPVTLAGGVRNGKVYGLSMGMNSWALFYNKSMLSAAGIKRPPTTLAQLDADQAKEWKISGGRAQQMGFYPFAGAGFSTYMPYFGVKGSGFVHGTYDLSKQPAARREAQWLATYNKYPYTTVQSFETTYGGTTAGYSEDPFALGKAGFYIDGPWEPFDDMAHDDPAMLKNFGVEAFPTVPGGPRQPSSAINGNYNIIPKGAKHARAAFVFDAWLSGFGSTNYLDSTWVTPIGQMPTSPAEASAPSFKAWVRKNPWLKTFVTELTSPYSEQITPTPAEAEYSTALGNAAQSIATKKMTPLRALQYVDRQANKALAKRHK